MPIDFKSKKLLTKTWYNPYTKNEKIEYEHLFAIDNLWTGAADRPGKTDLREEAILLYGTTCKIGGKTFHLSEVHADHKIIRSKFKDPQDADRLENIQILGTDCHRVKTQSDLKVRSRML